MPRRTWFAIGCVVLLAVTGCSDSPTGPRDSPTGPSAALDTAFVLAPGERTGIAGTSISVQFDRVEGDSRCPADALCIMGGDAVVAITVHDGGRALAYALHTGSMAPVRHDALTIELVELAPYRSARGRSLPPTTARRCASRAEAPRGASGPAHRRRLRRPRATSVASASSRGTHIRRNRPSHASSSRSASPSTV